tara:strand:+ start:1039 stop:1809 length:771 start_codon:yes stop_codon:yes gene_type:complete
MVIDIHPVYRIMGGSESNTHNGDYIMTATQICTKISRDTLDIFKNFATINSNILVKTGNTIRTISPVKNVMAEAVVSETFDTQFGIWDLNKFLGTVSLFSDPEFEFEDNKVTILGKNGSSVVYYYAEPRLLTTIDKEITMPDIVVDFNLTNSDMNDIQKAAAVLQLPDLVVRSSNTGTIELVALDKKDPSTNSYSLEVGDNESGGEFNFYFKVENMKMLPGNYDVSITEKVVSQFDNTTKDLKYWIALESDSNYNE